MPLKTRPSGPIPAKIMIVGEAPGVSEEQKGYPFVGSSGDELTKMLHEAGIARTECFLTNVCKYRPFNNEIWRFFEDAKSPNKGAFRRPGPLIKEGLEELHKEIINVKPNVIIACGNLAFWALLNRPSAKSGISDWRGSELYISERLATMEQPLGHKAVVIPIYHPAAILRQWAWRNTTVHDLRRRVNKYIEKPEIQVPNYHFEIRPTYEQVMEILGQLLRNCSSSATSGTRLSVDIETRQGHLACVGIGWSETEALCIPFLCVERQEGYWRAEEETAILLRLQDLLCHPKARVVGQNFLYDAQYFAYHFGFVPNVQDDTMFMQHVAYAGTPKGLDYLSSVYCTFHQFWKHEGKEWDKHTPEEQLWAYNCKDAVITYEVAEVLDGILDKLNLRKQYQFQMELWHHVLPMMLRGVSIDKSARAELAMELANALMEREHSLQTICGHPLNPRSPKQMRALFYDDLGLPKQYTRKRNADGTRGVTLDNDALETLARKEPLLRDFIRCIAEYRSLGVFLSTFVQARLGPDGRMRCYFNPAGTETYRFSSSEDAFGSGTNLQNIPRGLEDEAINITELVQYELPNIRKLFKPDTGYTIGEADLAGADAQIVAWEAEDEILKEFFRKKLKLHIENGKMMYGAAMMGADGKREPYYTRIKTGVHLTNYGGKAKTAAAAMNVTVHEAERFQQRWFEIHPAILEWHKHTRHELSTTRMVSNKFGFRRFYFDRIEDLLPEALAWKPQSTVALVANQGLINTSPHRLFSGPLSDFCQNDRHPNIYDLEIMSLRTRLKELGFQMLLQVHDSLVFQYPTRAEHTILPLLRRALTVTVPYNDPLIIPWGLKTSTVNWGEAKERAWPEVVVVN